MRMEPELLAELGLEDQDRLVVDLEHAERVEDMWSGRTAAAVVDVPGRG